MDTRAPSSSTRTAPSTAPLRATGTTCSILRWFLTSGTSLGQPPVVANGSLYVEEQYGDGGFIAVYDQNGVNACSYVCAPLYEDETDVPLASAIAVSGSEVLASNGDLLAFNENGCGQSTCQPEWQTSATCDGTPSVANGVVYVGVTEPCGTGVNAYNAASGALLRAFVSPDNSTVDYDVRNDRERDALLRDIAQRHVCLFVVADD